MLALVGCPFGAGRIELSQVQSSRPTGASACHDPLPQPTNRWIRAEATRQVAHIEKIWGEALDLFLSAVAMSKAAAEWHLTEATDQVRMGSCVEDPRLWPLTNIYARVTRIAFEVHWLSIGGFPRGALARARSMYELAVTSRVLAEHGARDGDHPDLAVRYSRSQAVDRYQDASQYNISAPIDQRFSDEEMSRWHAESEAAKREFGAELAKPRGWAKPLFPGKKGPIQIPDLEELAGFGGSRSFYRWANHEVHATARGGVLNTYVDDNGRHVHSTGRSHRSLGEPISMAMTYVAQTLLDVLTDTGSEDTTMKSLTLMTVRALGQEVERALLMASDEADEVPYPM